MSTGTRVLIGPDASPWLREAVLAADAIVVDDPQLAQAVVWRGSDHERLARLLDEAPNAALVQLGAAGTDAWAPTGLFDDGRIWASAKGAYSEVVAEHALALTLALLRELPRFVRADGWLPQAGTSLFERTVLVLGADGGIGREFIRLVAPFRPRVLRGLRHAVLDEDDRTLPLDEALAEADVVVLATPLTERTRGLLDARRFASMRPTSIVINVARGGVIDTDALVEALSTGRIAGAALDVTDPEPLPGGHPLWSAENCLITPHTANTLEMLEPRLAQRITENLRRFASDLPLIGVVDAAKGY